MYIYIKQTNTNNKRKKGRKKEGKENDLEINVDFSAGPVQQFLPRAETLANARPFPRRCYLHNTCSVRWSLERSISFFYICASVSTAVPRRVDESISGNQKKFEDTRRTTEKSDRLDEAPWFLSAIQRVLALDRNEIDGWKKWWESLDGLAIEEERGNFKGAKNGWEEKRKEWWEMREDNV